MRVLVVLSGSLEPGELEQRCAPAVGEGKALAVCFRFASGVDLRATLEAQREVTAALRLAFGGAAESIPVFVATDSDGERVEDCAQAWGATDVLT